MTQSAGVVNNSGIHFTKTETEYNMKSIRFLLLTITTMFIVIAALMIVLGISVYSHYHGLSFFYESGSAGYIMTPSSLSVFIGLALLLVSIFGFFGSLKLSTCMVNVYACILMAVFIIKLVVVILAFTMDSGRLLHYINVPVWAYNDPEIQQEMDALQSALGCCGSNSFMDYQGMEFTNNQTTVQATLLIDGELVTLTLPEVCCFSSASGQCDRVAGIGCKDALVNALIQNSTVIGVLGVSVMFINLLGIIFALLLARCIRKLKSARALITWKIKEKIIMEREAEDAYNKEAGQVYIDHQASSTA
ncbi:tetraspanin-33-like [Helicoverpa zea]|uniref:tetraspanin-33-like n=1 Tax=Helicoverpa zea TaxID=7113 RepID=UPI001F56B25D|nr:tetraspanin-33-like [Helicoverpa zea]